MDTARIAHPAKLTEEDPCFACYGGWVFIGHMAEAGSLAEPGEEIEVFEAIPCRRCQAKLESL